MGSFAWRFVGLFFLFGLVVGACGAPRVAQPVVGGVAAAEVGRRRAARWVRADGTRFVDERNVPLHLTGVVLSNDVWGAWVWPRSDALAKQGNDPMIRPDVQPSWVLSERDFQRLGALPGNVVRYEINHELFADGNPRRDANLARLVAHVERFATLGIGVIVDLNMPIGLDGQSDGFEKKKPGPQRERTFFEDDAFFAATVRLWTLVAQRLRDQPTLVGYELVNEPRAPCDADGGIAVYQRKLEALARAVRSADPRHVVFVPEYHSREANPGESYPDPNGGPGMRVDNGEQGVIWDRGLVKVDVANVAYVFHIYDPWPFTGEGAADFAAGEIEQKIADRERWRDQQPVERRVAWLSVVQSCLLTHDIGATFFNYKTAVTPWIGKNVMFGLFGQYWERNRFGQGTGAGYKLRDYAAQPATESGFVDLFRDYFRDLGPDDASVMGNDPIIAELRRFAAGAR